MAERRKHHYIPRFLLKRFASRWIGGKSLIWQISADTKAVEISTVDAAAAKYFYGKEETGVEKALALAEDRYSRALSMVRNGSAASDHIEALRGLLWTMAVRTRAVRNQFAGVAQGLVTALIDTSSTSEARRKLTDNLMSKLPDIIEKLPDGAQGAVRASLGKPEELVEAFLRSGLVEMAFDTFRGLAQEPKGGLRKATAEGQIQGLSGLLGEGGIPSSFAPGYWSIYQVADGPLILGDSCVVALQANGQFGGGFSGAGDWQALYLPIGPTEILVASRRENWMRPNAAALNQASAGLSDSYFYSSIITDEFKEFGRAIGSIALFLDDEQVQSIAGGAWKA